MGRKKKLTKLMLTLLKRFDMLELNRIYNSDCIEGMKQIESGEVDLIVTDPPYCIAYKTGRRADDHRFSKEILNDDNEQLIIDYMSECYRIAYLIGWIASCINKARLGIGDFVEIVDKEEK